MGVQWIAVMVVSLFAGVALAGCTVDVPPVEVQGPDRLEVGGAPVTENVSAQEDPNATFALQTQQQQQQQQQQSQFVNVQVEAEPQSGTSAVLLVVVRDDDTGEELRRERVTVEDRTTTDLTVNVGGRDNVVVVTQAVDGAATVNVAAREASAELEQTPAPAPAEPQAPAESGPPERETEEQAPPEPEPEAPPQQTGTPAPVQPVQQQQQQQQQQQGEGQQQQQQQQQQVQPTTTPVQTIQVGGAPSTVIVDAGTSPQVAFEVLPSQMQTQTQAQQATVEVTAVQQSASPAVLMIRAVDADTGSVVAEEQVTVENQTRASLSVSVGGRDNVVVVTQAVDGAATVNVAAREASADLTQAPTSPTGPEENATNASMPSWAQDASRSTSPVGPYRIVAG